jgi:hypothetical protein
MRQRWERERESDAVKLEQLRRVVVYAFPSDRPGAIVLIDPNRRHIETLVGPEMQQGAERLRDYDVIAAIEVRNLLQALGIDPGARRLAELGPPQKTRKLNRRGRTLKITTELLIRGSCGISRPFGDKARTLTYLRDDQEAKFRRRLEADAKALLALYQYGCLHHTVRLRWGFLDESLPAPWVYRNERSLYDLMKRSNEQDAPLEIVVGSAPGWEHPWSRARHVHTRKDPGRWGYVLVDKDGCSVYQPDIQAARLMGSEDRA